MANLYQFWFPKLGTYYKNEKLGVKTSYRLGYKSKLLDLFGGGENVYLKIVYLYYKKQVIVTLEKVSRASLWGSTGQYSRF